MSPPGEETCPFRDEFSSHVESYRTFEIRLTIIDSDLIVEPCIPGKYFFKDNPVENRYDAYLKETPPAGSTIEFVLNSGSPASFPASSQANNPVQQFYQMGTELQYGLLPPAANSLEIRGRSPGGQELGDRMIDLVGVNLPAWLPGAPAIDLSGNCRLDKHAALTYKWDAAFPEEPFKAQLEANQVPDWIPFVGGEALGIKETQAKLSLETNPTGQEGAVTIEGKTGLAVGGQSLSGQAKGKGDILITDDEGLKLVSAGAELAVTGQIQAEEGVGNIICKAATAGLCPLDKAESLPVVGKYIKKMNKALPEVEAAIQPTLSGTANFKSEEDELKWQESTLGSKLNLALQADFPLGDDVTAQVRAGGEPGAVYQFPPQAGNYVQEMSLTLFGGVEATALSHFKCQYDAAYKWAYPSNAAERGFKANDDENGCEIIDDPPENDALTYAIFEANNPALLRQSGSLVEAAIVTNVFAEGHPAIAAGSDTLLVWVHSDNTKPLLQGEEIYFSRYDGAAWSNPVGITNDNLQDFGPQIAFDRNNQVVAVWQRNKSQQSEATTSLNAAYTTDFEVAYAVWDGNAWTAPAFLTDNSAYDAPPRLLRGNDGQLLAIWRQNEAGELLGDSANPDKLMAAVWNGTAWSTPQPVTTLAGLLEYSGARHNGGTMTIVYSQDTDGDYGTPNDAELYQVAWDGGGWGTPRPLTTDGQADNSPSLFYTAAGQPQLLWLKGDSLYGLIGDLSGSPQEIASDGGAAMLAYRAAQTSDGHLAFLWQGTSESGTDVLYAVYNAEQNRFSDVRRLTRDRSLEKYLARPPASYCWPTIKPRLQPRQWCSPPQS